MSVKQEKQMLGRRIAVLIGTATLLGGCTVLPQSLTSSEARDRVTADQTRMYIEQEVIFEPISFEEAVARALKYNLDYRLKLMESALSAGLLELSNYDMLPSLVASAGYLDRNNDSGGTSVGIEDGEVSLRPSTSEERRRNVAAAEFSWNALDLGMSYYRAKQQADQYLIAEERRQRVTQNILQDVRSSYWRAVGAQRLAKQAVQLKERASNALRLSREAETQGLLPPREALTYQRLLLDAVALLTARIQELNYAKRELAALLNITPGTDFSVVESDEPPLLPVPFNIAELEEVALLNRPELREEDYRKRITADEAKRQMIALLPGLNLNFGAQYDSNKYLYNNNWADVGLRLSFNLLKPLSYGALQQVHEAQRMDDEARRLALTMAVITQVRLAVERYGMALNDLDIARESNRVDQRLATYARAAALTRAESELEMIRAEARALNSEYQRYAAYASAQAAFGRIYNSLGLSVLPNDTTASSVAELAQAVAEHVRTMEEDVFPGLTDTVLETPPLSLVIDLPEGLSSEIGSAELSETVSSALKRNRIRVAPQTGPSAQLRMSLELESMREGVRRAHWNIQMFDAAGVSMGSTRYSSALPAGASVHVHQALAESAIVANLKNIEAWSGVRPANPQASGDISSVVAVR